MSEERALRYSYASTSQSWNNRTAQIVERTEEQMNQWL